MKNIRSYDPRKKQIVEALRKKSGCSKITMLEETAEGFRGSCLKSKGNRCFENMGKFTVTREEAGL